MRNDKFYLLYISCTQDVTKVIQLFAAAKEPSPGLSLTTKAGTLDMYVTSSVVLDKRAIVCCCLNWPQPRESTLVCMFGETIARLAFGLARSSETNIAGVLLHSTDVCAPSAAALV
jgi:hypothetical protein